MPAGPASLAAWAGRRKASGSHGDREAGLQSLLAYAAAEESIEPAFQKTGPGVCCRRSLKCSSYFLLLDDGLYRPVDEAMLGSDSIRPAALCLGHTKHDFAV